jgi:hypothetical protein
MSDEPIEKLPEEKEEKPKIINDTSENEAIKDLTDRLDTAETRLKESEGAVMNSLSKSQKADLTDGGQTDLHIHEGQLSAAQKTDLTDGGATTLHSHAYTDNIGGVGVYGDGSDGELSIISNSQSSGTWVANGILLKDIFPNNLEISGGDLDTGGYRIFVKGTLTINAGKEIHRNGNHGGNGNGTLQGDGGIAGAALASGTVYGSEDGKVGGDGNQVASASPGVAGDNITQALGVAGKAGGAGGDSSPYTGGAAGAAGTVTAASSRAKSSLFLLGYDITAGAYPQQLKGSAGSGSGGGGSAAGAKGGGGGGSGSPGGTVWIACKTLVLNGKISARGGNGGNGGNGTPANDSAGGGGGAGGNGGLIFLIYNTKSGSGSTDVAGGNKGVKGTGYGNATAAEDGTAGAAGVVIEIINI